MSRISHLPPAQWDQELRLLLQPDAHTELEQGIYRMLAHAPAVALAYARFNRELKGSLSLDTRLLEVVRLRVAFHNQCRSCMAIRYSGAVDAGLDEAVVCELRSPTESELLTEAEKAAVRFADRLSTDHWSVDDGDYAALREHFSEAQIVELGIYCAQCIGIGRFTMTLDMVEDLPESFRDSTTGETAPWQAAPVVLSR